MKRARVILADEHTLMEDALKKLLETEFEVVGVFSDGLSLVEGAPELEPDLIVLGIHMSNMDGLLAGQRLKHLMPRVKLIYLTMYQDPDLAARAFRLDASGYLLKNSAAAELFMAVRVALRGGSYVTPLMTQDMVGPFIQHFKNRKEPRPLTQRQKEVLQLLAEGRPMKEVAIKLNISARTVAFHKYTIMEHLNLRNHVELIGYAMKHSFTTA